MSQCTHTDTQVTNSRPPDAVGGNGGRLYSQFPYPAITVRVRKCKHCGHRFSTIEVAKEFLDGVTSGKPQRKRVTTHPLDSVRAYLAAHAPISVKDALDYLRGVDPEAVRDYTTVFRTLSQMRLAYADEMLKAGVV